MSMCLLCLCVCSDWLPASSKGRCENSPAGEFWLPSCVPARFHTTPKAINCLKASSCPRCVCAPVYLQAFQALLFGLLGSTTIASTAVAAPGYVTRPARALEGLGARLGGGHRPYLWLVT